MYTLTPDSEYAGFDQVNLAGGSSGQSSLSRLQNGGFASVVESDQSILVRIYDADGHQTGADVIVASNGYNPEIVGLASGGFAVVWESSDDSLNGIYLQLFDPAGTPTSPVREVNSQQFGNQSQPDIVELADGNLVVAWTDNGDDGVGNVVFRVFAGDGLPIGNQVSVTSNDFVQSYYPRLAALNEGGFAISWTGPSEDWQSGGSFTEVSVRIVNSDYEMQPVSFSSWDISQGPSSHDAFFSSIAVLASGDIVVTWTDAPASNAFVYGQRLDSSGSAIGEPFQIGSTDPQTGQSSVVALTDGGFLVTWRADTDDGGPNYFQRGELYAQRYDAEANSVGDRIVVNQFAELGQDLPSVVEFGSGDLYFMFRDFTDTASFVSRTFYDVTNGTSTSDLLTGTGGVDILRGLDGNDVLVGGAANDVLDGGAGFDIAAYSNASSGIRLALDTPSLARDLDSGSVDTLVSIEAVRGSAFDDGLYGSMAADTLLGDAGRDDIRGYGGGDTIDGGVGNDSLYGGGGDDDLTGNAGDDYLDGGNGNDTASYFAAAGAVEVRLWNSGAAQNTLGAGIDILVSIENLEGSRFSDLLVGDDLLNVLRGDDGNDLLKGLGGNDALKGGRGDDQLVGGYGDDIVRGGEGNDVLIGDVGYDVMFGDEGDDFLKGANGTDRLYGGTGHDIIEGGNQTDYLFGQQGDDILLGDAGDDFIQGNAGVDILNGGAGNDRLDGNNDNDLLRGGDGNDILIGSWGVDTMTGGTGADTFLFKAGHTGRLMTTADTILDFTSAEGDVIDLSLIDAIAGGGDDAFTFIGDAAFSGTAGELRFFLSDGRAYVAGDTDGDGVGDLFIALDGVTDLSAGDFVL